MEYFKLSVNLVQVSIKLISKVDRLLTLLLNFRIMIFLFLMLTRMELSLELLLVITIILFSIVTITRLFLLILLIRNILLLRSSEILSLVFLFMPNQKTSLKSIEIELTKGLCWLIFTEDLMAHLFLCLLVSDIHC